MYKAIYLPIDKPLTDGCIIINQRGEHFVYDESNAVGWDLKLIRPAELYIVEVEFNEMNIIGKPSAAALK